MNEESGNLPPGTIVKDGYYFCVVCNCWANESHLQSSRHERAMKRWHQAASPAMVCNPSLHQNLQTWGAASAEVVREGYFPPAWGDRNCFVWKPETCQWWCRLCYKYADDNHIASATHVKRAAYPYSYLYDGTSSHHQDFSGPPPLPPPSATGASTTSWWSQPSSRDSIRKSSPWAALDCEDPLPSAYSPHTAATQPPPLPGAQPLQACPLPSSQGSPPDVPSLHSLTSTSPSVVHKVDSLNDGSLAPWALTAFGSSSQGSGSCTSTNADLGHAASCVPDAAAQAPTHLMPTRAS